MYVCWARGWGGGLLTSCPTGVAFWELLVGYCVKQDIGLEGSWVPSNRTLRKLLSVMTIRYGTSTEKGSLSHSTQGTIKMGWALESIWLATA